ncbi:MAG: hypothetical protein ACLS6O_01650 [Bifidobacterium sp.]
MLVESFTAVIALLQPSPFPRASTSPRTCPSQISPLPA